MEILRTENLKKYYEQGASPVKAIDGVNISVAQGEFVAIVGTSGSGKSTLLNMLGGLDRPTAGKVFVDGKDIFSLKDEELTIFRRRKIGFVFQAFNLVPVLNVYENVVLPIQLDGNEVDEAYVKEIIDILGLSEKVNSMPNQLSGGQQQRVGIARALAASPDILLMDEPFGAVDAITREQLQNELKEIHKKTGITILFVTHDIEEALKLGTKVLVMEHGEIQQYGTPKELLQNPATDFVKKLVEKQRRMCFLPEEKLKDCEYCGAACGAGVNE